jgi:tetratricopeptide (TPR) repeat protein
MGRLRMKTLLPFLLALASVMPSMAQNIILKSGEIVATKGVRRMGDNIMASVELPPPAPGQPAMMGELGYAIPQIATIDFPEPAALIAATGLINSGNPQAALQQLQPVLSYYGGFADAPGSWWAQATVIEEQALIRLGRTADAETLAAQMAHSATDPDSVRAADVYLAAAMARRGDHAKALEIYDAVLRDAIRPQTLAVAAENKGQSHLAREEWEQALLSLLQIPVFYPEEQVMMPDVLLGSAQAYIGLRDLTRAKAALNQLESTYSLTPEATQGKAELQRVAKLEQSLAPPK